MNHPFVRNITFGTTCPSFIIIKMGIPSIVWPRRKSMSQQTGRSIKWVEIAMFYTQKGRVKNLIISSNAWHKCLVNSAKKQWMTESRNLKMETTRGKNVKMSQKWFCTITFSSKRDHDISSAIVKSGEIQRGHIWPNFEGFSECLFNLRMSQIRGIIHNPIQERKFQLHFWKEKAIWEYIFLGYYFATQNAMASLKVLPEVHYFKELSNYDAMQR